MHSYRERIYNSYVDAIGSTLFPYSKEEYELDRALFKKNYSKHLPIDKNTKILELGCGQGLFAYFLQKEGYTNYTGVDTSPQQLEIAKRMAGIGDRGKFIQKDVFAFLGESIGKYRLIVARHILEHMKKDEVIQFLDLIYNALEDGGKVIIEVPNALHFFAGYSRYIDFTHEVLFTQDSLKEVLAVCKFKDIIIAPVNSDLVHSFRSILRIFMKMIWRIFLKALFYIEHGIPNRKIFFDISIYAIATK
ncbi:MAG: hypothetical protein A2W23_07095 [Planctomycetes bacterium RBG_16_43_13]|nr:MAG: hypothetical protein A2W23_07095 [Planctomycetes bacterium RBG_16_43_13]